VQRRQSLRRGRLDNFFSNASLSLRNTATSSSKHTAFTVLRHRLPVAITGADRPNDRQYTLKPEADPDSPVECVVLCPDWVDVNGPERSLKIALRLRAKRPDMTVGGVTVDPLTRAGPGIEYAGDVAGVGIASMPMLRAKAPSDDPYTNVLELGMEVEEVERFR
jgi:hypothetical protein